MGLMEGPKQICHDLAVNVREENNDNDNAKNKKNAMEQRLKTPEIEDILLAELEYDEQIIGTNEEKWDYNIKLSDDEQENNKEENDKDSELLTLLSAIDSKFKQSTSLVDVLMNGPDQIKDSAKTP